MQIKIRLSSRYDFDIIDMLNNNIDIKSILVNTLYATANNMPITLDEVPKTKKAYPNKYIQLYVSDKSSIELLNTVVKGQKANFLKHLLRCSFNTPYIQCYFAEQAPMVKKSSNNTPLAQNASFGQNLTSEEIMSKPEPAKEKSMPPSLNEAATLPPPNIISTNVDTIVDKTTSNIPPNNNNDDADVLAMFDNL